VNAGSRSVEIDVPRQDIWKILVAPGRRDWYYRLNPLGDFAEGSHVSWVDIDGKAVEESDVVAVEPEESNGKFTGRYVGTHTYQEGKVRAVHAFLAARGTTLADCADSIFYSDSINDLPLLEAVAHPVVTNGDARLRAIAAQRGWPTLDLFALVHGA